MNKFVHSRWGLGLFLVALAAFGQQPGTIAGTVKDALGGTVAGAAVQATNSSTSAVFKATSSKQGAFTLPDLPAGTARAVGKAGTGN